MAKPNTDVKVLQAAILDLDELPGESSAFLRKHYAAPVRKACPSRGRKSCQRRRSCPPTKS
jgi:hypothetical protein